MENYIVINGKKAELTEEQLKALGIEIEKDDPFELKEGGYYSIDTNGYVCHDWYCDGCLTTQRRHNIANYCTDRKLLEQRALHETLNRLLWRYSMQHNGDKIDWDDPMVSKYKIYRHSSNGNLLIDTNTAHHDYGTVYFKTSTAAQNAIDEIIIPFMKEHPEFKF